MYTNYQLPVNVKFSHAVFFFQQSGALFPGMKNRTHMKQFIKDMTRIQMLTFHDSLIVCDQRILVLNFNHFPFPGIYI